jgi:pimeloyl-ACP methyl ester carboxylesterase
MSNRPLLIIHGWSDSSTSFNSLAQLIEAQIGRNVQVINLADYLSMDDEITLFDLAAAMQTAWLGKQLPLQKGAVDIIAHSTGALVVRLWLQLYYANGAVPIKNLVLLAPANFGSALAHKGRAFYGRIIKGFNSEKMFQVGAKILKGLELASPFSFNLAIADRFNENNYFGQGDVLCTVLVGNTGYSGISAAANEAGSDGTVRIAAANLNCAMVDIDFSIDPLHPTYHYKSSYGQVAFAIMDGENHSSIINGAGGFRSTDTLPFIIQSLMVTDQDFTQWVEQTAKHTQLITNLGVQNSNKQGFQQIICHVDDQFQQAVPDYFIEFYGENEHTDRIAELFHVDTIQDVHPYGNDTSYRCLYMNCTRLYQAFNQYQHKLLISLTALPEFIKQGEVGYRTFTDTDIGSVAIMPEDFVNLFQDNRSLIVRIKLKREQSPRVFEIKALTAS